MAPSHPVRAVDEALSNQAASEAKDVGSRLTVDVVSGDVLPSTLEKAFAANRPPDFALVGSAVPAPLAARGLLVDARETLDRIVALNGELFPPLRVLAAAGPFFDRQPHQPDPAWAIPYAAMGGALLVRKDLLAQKGIPFPKTFDDARAASEKVTDVAAGVYGWGAPSPIGEAMDGFVQATLLDHGAAIFDSLGIQVALNLDEASASLDALAGLSRAHDGSPLSPTGTVDWSTTQTAAAFVAGTIIQTIDFGGMYARLVTDQTELRSRIAALPPPAGPKGWYTSAPTTLLIVPRRGQAPDRALSLVERLIRPENYDVLVRAGLGSVIPPYAYTTKTPFWDEDPNYHAFVANARGDPARNFQFASMGYPSPPTLPAAVVWAANVLSKTVRAVITGETSAALAASALKQQCEILARDAIALQPLPTSTAVPFWSGLIAPLRTPTP